MSRKIYLGAAAAAFLFAAALVADAQYAAIPNIVGPNAGEQFRGDVNDRFDGQAPISPSLVADPFASLPPVKNGALYYCSDCTQTPACAAGGMGAIAIGVAGAWTCARGALKAIHVQALTSSAALTSTPVVLATALLTLPNNGVKYVIRGDANGIITWTAAATAANIQVTLYDATDSATLAVAEPLRPAVNADNDSAAAAGGGETVTATGQTLTLQFKVAVFSATATAISGGTVDFYAIPVTQ